MEAGVISRLAYSACPSYTLRVRLGVALVLSCFASLSLGALPACSGGYPLPPTKCDEYCDATKGMMCDEYYEPAGCVLSCEQGELDDPACSKELDDLIACYRQNPALTKQCDWYGDENRACNTEWMLHSTCVAAQYLLRNPQPQQPTPL